MNSASATSAQRVWFVAMRATAAALVLLLVPTSLMAEKPEARDPVVEDLQIDVDLRPAQQFLYGQLGQYIESPALKGQGCKAAALRVAKVALFQYDLQTHLRAAAKSTFEGIRDGAKIAGAKRASKVAQIAAEVVAAYDTDQPEAALGRVIVKNSVDWATEEAKEHLPKTGKEKIDDKVEETAKAAGEKAKEKLIETLFRGDLSQRITENFSVHPYAACTPASVTVEFQKAGAPLEPGQTGPTHSLRGGLFVLIRGECQCGAKNEAELRQFQVSYTMPLERLDARLEYEKGSIIVAINDVRKASQELWAGAQKSVSPDKGKKSGDKDDEEKPDLKKLAQDLADKAKGASSLSMRLVLTPRFKMPPLDEIDIHASCGCRLGTGTTGGITETPPSPHEPEYIPSAGDCPPCSALYVKAEKAKEDADRVTAQRDDANHRLKSARDAELAAQRKLDGIARDPRWKNGANPGQRQAAERAAKNELAEAKQNAAAASNDLARLAGKPEAAMRAADAAQRAYELCKKEHCPPRAEKIDPCLVGTWVATGVDKIGGFRVTFTADGTQTVDYNPSQPWKLGNDKFVWTGISSNRIATSKGVARSIEEHHGSATMTLTTPVLPAPHVWKLGTMMGPGGLGSTTGDNKYVCLRNPHTAEKGEPEGQGDILTYQGSLRLDRSPNYEVKLKRLKP